MVASHCTVNCTVTLATSVNYDNKNKNKSIDYKKGCWLCQSEGIASFSNHKIFNCSKFKTADDKLRKIDAVNGCRRCGFLNHNSSKCKFSFSGKCSVCDQYHASFLCNKKSNCSNSSGGRSENRSKTGSQNNANKSHVNVSESVVMQTSHSSDIVVPTFTAKLNGNDSGKCIYSRVMYDPASQSSFVTENMLSKIEHSIIDNNVKINIIGFNASKILCTKKVEFSLSVDGKLSIVCAIVVPSIKTKVKSSMFNKIVKSFKNNNITLADKHLHDNDDGVVDMLLGVDAAHILPVHSCRFGSVESPSLLYYCAAGVMLAGDVSVLVSNLKHLNMVKQTMEKFRKLF